MAKLCRAIAIFNHVNCVQSRNSWLSLAVAPLLRTGFELSSCSPSFIRWIALVRCLFVMNYEIIMHIRLHLPFKANPYAVVSLCSNAMLYMWAPHVQCMHYDFLRKCRIWQFKACKYTQIHMFVYSGHIGQCVVFTHAA